MTAYPHFTRRLTHDLNRLWDFVFLPESRLDKLAPEALAYTDRLPVPSAFDALPAYAGKRGIGVYRTAVEVTPDTPSVLKIGAAGMTVKVYIDGVATASHIGSYTPFEVLLPAAPHSRREIVVATENRFDYKRNPLQENFFDFYNYGGIFRPVCLEELPEHPLRQAFVTVDDLQAGRIRVVVDLDGAGTGLTCRIDDGDPQAVHCTTLPDHRLEFHTVVPNPTLWSPATPNLHTLTLDTGSDAMTVRFGLREVRTENGRVLLNGEPVKLLGYCRHEAHPQFGPATPVSLMAADLQQMRDQGCNFVRGSHYQQDARFLDLCDELGFLVFSESLAWGQHQKQLADPAFIEAQLDQTRVMVQTDFNHPSIIIWGFLNEGASDAEFARGCYEKLISLIRSLDATRLVTYASNRYLTDLFLEQVDLVCFNMYPGWYSSDRDNEHPLDEVLPRIKAMLDGLRERGVSDKPFIISEIGAGAIYGCHDALAGYWSEEYQAELLKLVCQETVTNPAIAGLAIWQFCDIRTYQGSGALGRPRSFNNKGTVDEYRRPKLACSIVKTIFSSHGN